MKKGAKIRFLLRVITLCALISTPIAAQRKSEAVKEPTPGTMIKESSLDYRLWESFVLVRRANDGEAAAQHELGLRFLQGRGFQADTSRAAYWLQRAADQNFDLAHFNLGILALNGWGIPWNPFVAFDHFEHASRKGMPEADFLLGLLYTENLIIRQDWPNAFRLVARAAEAGFEPAKRALEEFRRRGITGGDSVHPDTAGASWTRPLFLDFDVDTSSGDESRILHELLKAGTATLRKALGANPIGPLGPDSSASALIARAARAGSPEALTMLGRFAERGVGSRADRIAAGALYLVAVRNESFRALELLWNLVRENGFTEELEKRTKRNDAVAQFVYAGLVAAKIEQRVSGHQALRLLLSSVSHQYVEAIIELGLCHHSGRWVDQDRLRARELWEKAAERGSTEALIRLKAVQLFSENPAVSAAIVRLFQDQAEEGSILAQVALGYCFERGLAVGQDDGKASQLYRDAAQRGSQSAYDALKRMHDRIRPDLEKWRVE